LKVEDVGTRANMAEPTISGKLSFHVIVDDFHRTFSIDGPSGPNGVRLHYEMLQAGRIEKKKLRDFDLRADSHEAVLTEMHNGFPDYQFVGTWASYIQSDTGPADRSGPA
jgi:hypothetical protein